MATHNERNTQGSIEMFIRIANSIAGGESSYARLRSGIELCIERTAGARMWDVDGNEYIDYCLGYGPLIFGHQPAEIIESDDPRFMQYLKKYNLVRVTPERAVRRFDLIRVTPQQIYYFDTELYNVKASVYQLWDRSS